MTSPAEQRYRKKADLLFARGERLSDAYVRRLLRDFDAIRLAILDRLVDLAGTGSAFEVAHLRQMSDAIDMASLDLERRYLRLLRNGTAEAIAAGDRLQGEAFAAAGVSVAALPLTDANWRTLQVAQSLSLDLVRDVSAEFRQAAKRSVTLGVMGAKPRTAVIKELRDLLATQTAKRGKIVNRAVLIQRNEMGSIFSLANTLRQQEIGDAIPEMLKWWSAAKDERTRDAHRDVGRDYSREKAIPVKQDFVVAGERAKGPHDPRMSAANRINCRCRVYLVHPDWLGEQ